MPKRERPSAESNGQRRPGEFAFGSIVGASRTAIYAPDAMTGNRVEIVQQQ